MRKLLGTLAILAIIILSVGYFRGWFTVTRDSRPDETNVQIKVDKDKIKEDASKAKEKAQQTIDNFRDSDNSSE